MAPRVLVDATAVPADRGGVGRYVDGLIAALGAADADLAVVCQRARTGALLAARAECDDRARPRRRRPPPRPAGLGADRAAVGRGQVKADVVHSPYYTMPLRLGCPVLVTVHDATFFTQPTHTAVKGTFFRSATRTAARRATRVIVPSKATRDELIRVLDADPTTIDVAYHGVDTELFHPPDRSRARAGSTARLGLHGQPYVAFLGTLEPRKNVPALVRGWAGRGPGSARPRPPWCWPAAAAGTPGSTRGGRRAVPPAGGPPRRPALLRPARTAGRRPGRGLPEPGRGLRAAGAGGDGLRRAGATTRKLALPEVGGDAVAYTERGRRPSRAALHRAARRCAAPRGAGQGGLPALQGVHLGRQCGGPPGVVPAGGRAGSALVRRGQGTCCPAARPGPGTQANGWGCAGSALSVPPGASGLATSLLMEAVEAIVLVGGRGRGCAR